MSILNIVNKVKEESRGYLDSHYAADNWVMIPERSLITILVNELAKERDKRNKEITDMCESKMLQAVLSGVDGDYLKGWGDALRVVTGFVSDDD